MSNPSSVPPTGLSKSAAKKRAKKAAKAAAEAGFPISVPRAGTISPTLHNNPPPVAPPLPPSSAPDPLDPNLFNFSAPGSYPVDVQYDSNGYYDEVDVPLNQTAFPGGYSIDYNLSLQNSSALAGLSAPFNITHDDLISAANELYKRMADPEFGADDAYWSSLPPHIRQFIRDAVPFTGSISQNTPGNNSSQRTMYQMAQQIVQAASQGMGLGQGMGPNLMSGVNGMGRQYNQPSIGEELGFHRHPDAKDEDYDDEDDYDGDEPEYVATNGDVAPKKKNKKKKKKNAAKVEQPPMSQPLPPPKQQPPRQPMPSQPPVQQPALNPPPPPVTPAPAHPPPSSRAAGKQPMSNTTAPAANPPARSARAAGKAPASAAPAHGTHSGHTHSHPPANTKTNAKGKAPAAAPPAKIWTQSSAEDRENIRLFWLGLNEAERRDLLRIEKDAVLRKMKEQHRHSCGCAVCGRKKVNIEMELDQLYEQYYDELRSYAAEQRAAANGVKPPPSGAGPFPGSVEVDATGAVTRYDHRAPDPSGEHEHDDIDGEESEEYDEEDDYADEEELEDEEIGSDEADVGDDIDDAAHPPPPARAPRQPPVKAPAPRPEGGDDFLSFGSSLATIKGGILTIADDMLKNDGSKFLEMMEQLAIRRSVREEQNLKDLQEETDDDDDASKDEPLTDAERMAEGKRMFQIFAARMFEQRVLQAYREKVAKQREEQLLRELEEEEDSKRAKEEKKAKEAQKKKDKKRLQKQKADEEKAAREAALAEEQRAAKARAEEQERERHRKQEEERARREAVKKAAQEEAQRQATERKKRQQEEKEREEEATRKKREREEKARKEREAREKEAKEREKREKEERLAKEKAEKERVAKEKAEKAERDRLAKEAKDKADKESLAKLEEERKEKAKRDEAERKEREAAEQAKMLATQQAQRERAKAEVAAERAAAVERAAAEKRSASIPAPPPIGVQYVKSPRNNSTPSTPPITHPSPVKAARPPSGPSSVARTQKTPQPYFPQPMPPVGVAGFQRMPVPQTFAPGYRPAYSNQSPAFSPPQTNGPSISPNPPPRGFPPEPSPPFEHGMRTAPIGMGFPPVKQPTRIPSVDETFSPPTAPIGSTSSRHPSAGEIGSSSLLAGPSVVDDFRPSPAPIAPPNLGPIGRPSAFLDQPQASGSSALRSASPAQPEQVFGSAALGGDDEIVQPQRRNLSNGGWDVPVAAAPGTGRWSSSPSIWGSSDPVAASGTSWGAPGVGMPTIGERPTAPGLSSSIGPGQGVGSSGTGSGVGAGTGVPGQGRQPSFGGIGSGFGGLNQGVGMGAIGSFPQNLFSPPTQPQHPHPPHHQ
ncbi:stress response protein NST1 [Kwoniella heveanensis CBS 569]|nr:stress response protein NST1 [Kwoniella heveanensis CBS 569]